MEAQGHLDLAWLMARAPRHGVLCPGGSWVENIPIRMDDTPAATTGVALDRRRSERLWRAVAGGPIGLRRISRRRPSRLMTLEMTGEADRSAVRCCGQGQHGMCT